MRLCAGSCCAVLLPPAAALRPSGEAVLCRTRHGLSTVWAEERAKTPTLNTEIDISYKRTSFRYTYCIRIC